MTASLGDIGAGAGARLNLVRHLEFFTTVAEERHFGRAAARLGIAQPPLSQGIRRLETSLGVTLFDRGRGGAALTAAGRDLLPRARAVLDETAALRSAAARYARGSRRVHLGVAPEVGARLAADMAAAAGRCSGARVEVSVDTSMRLLDQVAAELVDLAVVTHPVPLERLVGDTVVGLPTGLLLPGGHRAAAEDGPVGLRALSDLEFATNVRSAGPAAFDLLVETLDIRGCTSPVTPVPDPAAVLALVAGGHAFTLVPDADPAHLADDVVRRPLAGAPIPLRLRAVRRPPTGRPSVAATTLDTVVDAVSRTLMSRAGQPA